MVTGAGALGVYLFTTPGCACEDTFPQRIYHLAALNPMRDHTPEATAQAFLRDQGKGTCLPVSSELCRYALSSHPVIDSRLWAREDTLHEVKLYYRVKARENSDPFWGEAEVDVERQRDRWIVTSYGAEY